MKKIAITITILFITVASLKAQIALKTLPQYTGTTLYNGLLGNYNNNNIFDTITGVGTKYLISPIIKGWQKTVQVALYLSRLSGASVGGKATLEGSIDGLRFYSIGADTAKISPQYSFYGWKLTDWSNLYLRIKVDIDSVSTVQIGGHFFTRKEEHAN